MISGKKLNKYSKLITNFKLLMPRCVMKILFALFLIISLSSCATEKRRNIDIEIDNSTSVSPQTFERYVDIIINDIIKNMKEKDCLSIKFIDECSLTQSDRIFNLDLSQKDFSEGTDGFNNAADSIKMRIEKFINDSISVSLRNIIYKSKSQRADCSQYTNIIEALNQSIGLKKELANYDSELDIALNNAAGEDTYNYENVIIIFSDMINEDRGNKYSFTGFSRINEKDINDKLSQLEAEKRIPDLRDYKIIVCGATASNKLALNADTQIKNIKLFWDQFFRISGSNLIAYGYDTEYEIINFMKN